MSTYIHGQHRWHSTRSCPFLKSKDYSKVYSKFSDITSRINTLNMYRKGKYQSSECNINLTLINPGWCFDSWYYYSSGIISILFIGRGLILGLIPVYIATVHPLHSKAICNPLAAFMDWGRAWILFQTFEKWLLCNCIPVTFICFSNAIFCASNDICHFSQFKITLKRM